MAELPFLPLATDAYLADCAHLSDAEHGRYLLILMALWRAPRQRMPNDNAWLARRFNRPIGRVVSELRPLLEEFCKCDGNWITQKRLSKEFSYVVAQSKKQSERAKARWNKDKVPSPGNAQRHASGNAPTPTPTPTIDKKERERAAVPTRASAIPPDWQPSADDLAWAKTARPDLQQARLKLETDGFKSHAIGNNRTGHDWGHLWRGWISKAKIGGQTNGTNRSRPSEPDTSIVDGINAALARRPVQPG